MLTHATAVEQIRKLNRNVRLDVSRTSTPAAGEDYFVQRTGAPDGSTTNALTITRLRVKFSIQRDLSKHPNRTEIEMYNLSDAARAAMETDPLVVDLAAGHAGVNKMLVTGDVHYAMSEQDGPNWVTKLQLSDGGRAFKNSRVSKSYRGGTTVKTMIRDCAQAMGQKLPRNVENDPALDEQFASGSVILGRTPQVMTRLLATYGYTWSIQNGVLQMLRDAEPNNTVLVISELTGMIGSPRMGNPKRNGKPPKMEISMLLYPELSPGDQVLVDADAVKGFFKLLKVRHNGDSEGDEWFTEVEVVPVSGPAR